MLSKQNTLAIVFIFVGFFSRVLPHFENFTAIYAIALFSGAFLQNKRLALLLPIGIMMSSDLILGFSPYLPTYMSFIAIVFVGRLLQKKQKIEHIILGGISASLLFFMITNLFVWINSSPADGIFYCPKTLVGLIKCYTQAIPFFWNTLCATMLYSTILFYSFRVINSKLFKTVK
ncbi:MAG: hypothetical protein CMP62_00750 [Flavobacteriales bacterium]|nr:hypothetical protein [Flavobacteriales bacterium]